MSNITHSMLEIKIYFSNRLFLCTCTTTDFKEGFEPGILAQHLAPVADADGRHGFLLVCRICQIIIHILCFR